MRRLPRLAVGLVAAVLLTPLLTTTSAHAVADHTRTIRWETPTRLAAGTFDGVRLSGSDVVLSAPRHVRTHTDPYGARKPVRWSYGSWTSPWTATGTQADALVPSWGASVPDGTWLRVLVRTRRGTTAGSWDLVGEWSYGPKSIRRASGLAQKDDLARVDVDTLRANPNRRFSSFQVRVELMRAPGSTLSPRLRSVSATTSSYVTRSAPTSRTTMTTTRELKVPAYSQMTHRGHYPQWGGGGEAWCSPTSIAMLLRYAGTRPAPATYAWAGTDGQVDHAARYSYDHRYRGTGNWGFSTAYATQHGTDAFVTRLHDLRDAEAFIRAGIPLAISVRFGRGELYGSPISSTNGHLMVVRGFTQDGKVIVNDPAGARNSAVRRVYDRAQLERAWLRGSGGITYVVRAPGTALPADTLRW